MTTPARPRIIALLGAESTGKTTLSLALADALRAQGLRVALVPEVLREWCEARGRTPRADEQAAIAREQARRVQAACAAQPDIVVADTAPLMTAVYSDLLFGDRALYPEALAWQRRVATTLLMGLDLPWVAEPGIRDGAHVREPVDALLREALQGARLPYRVVYGQGHARLDAAMLAIDSIAPDQDSTRATARKDLQCRPWTCERCAEPDCEHRLFAKLLPHSA